MKRITKSLFAFILFLTCSSSIVLAQQSKQNEKLIINGSAKLPEFDNTVQFLGKVNDKLMFITEGFSEALSIKSSVNHRRNIFYSRKPQLFIVNEATRQIQNTISLKKLFKSNKITDAYVVKGRLFFSVRKSNNDFQIIELDESGSVLVSRDTKALKLKKVKPTAIVPSADGEHLLLINQTDRMDNIFGPKRSKKNPFAILDLNLNLVHQGMFKLDARYDYLKVFTFSFNDGNLVMCIGTGFNRYLAKIGSDKEIVKITDKNQIKNLTLLKSPKGRLRFAYTKTDSDMNLNIGLLTLDAEGGIMSDLVCSKFDSDNGADAQIKEAGDQIKIKHVVENKGNLTFILERVGQIVYNGFGNDGISTIEVRSYPRYRDLYVIKQDENFKNSWSQQVRNRFEYYQNLIDYVIGDKLYLYYTTLDLAPENKYYEPIPGITNQTIFKGKNKPIGVGKTVVFDMNSGEFVRLVNSEYVMCKPYDESKEKVILYYQNNKQTGEILLK